MSLFSFIVWDFNPKIFPDGIFGWEPPIVWYGLLFALGFLLGQQILIYIYKKEGKPEQDIETLTVYMIVATVIGARLGHVFFYEPARYLANPIEIIQIWKGGLASHGATIGILTALWIYSKYDIRFKGLKLTSKKITRPGQNFLQVVDRIVIVVALAGSLIRLGNFTNSEIEGIPTDSNYGVVFVRNVSEYIKSSSQAIEDIDFEKGTHETPDTYVPVTMEITFDEKVDINQGQLKGFAEGRLSNILESESYFVSGHIYKPNDEPLSYKLINDHKLEVYLNGIARHPAQLYESGTTFMIFVLLLIIWWYYREHTPPGLLLGLFLIILFGLRFIHEFFKENQVAFEDQMTFNMGQILSIPLVLIGIGILVYALNHKTVNSELEN